MTGFPDHPDAASRTSLPALGVILLVVVAGHLSLYPGVADLDGFYHIGHAAAYLEGSLFDTTLPWATQSIIQSIGADLWWGFHMLLLPFAALGDPATGVRLAAVALTTTLALTAFWVLRRHDVPHAALWTVAFLVAVPNVSYRFLMVRPHVLSLAASLTLVSVLVRGRWWHALLLAAAISWTHVTLFWVAPGIVVAYAMVRLPLGIAAGPNADDRSIPLGAALAAVLAGTLLGWLLRPQPLATASLMNVQLVWIFTQRLADLPLTFAAELFPIGPAELARTSWLYLALWLGAVTTLGVAVVRGGLLERLGEERSGFALTAMLVSVAFLGVALFSARRAMVQWVVFGFVVLPFAWRLIERAPSRAYLRPLAAILVLAHLGWGAWRHTLNLRVVSFPGSTLADVADFLEAESRPGEVVFHARWDNFGPLFAHNRTNHYLSGMDPIFHFARDPASYWEYFYLSADVNVEWSCDAFPCSSGISTDSHTVIRDHFGARWAVVEPRRNPRLALHFLNDERFRLALDTGREALFEVLPDTTDTR